VRDDQSLCANGAIFLSRLVTIVQLKEDAIGAFNLRTLGSLRCGGHSVRFQHSGRFVRRAVGFYVHSQASGESFLIEG